MNYEAILKSDEKALLGLRSLYKKYGYCQYKMSKFEEYDLYVRNKDFLVSDSVITFTDSNGKLLALKPDVTLSIIKNSVDTDKCVQKVYYNENVYRVSKSTHDFTEIMQTGLECIGDIDLYNICEVIMLAAESLSIISSEYILDISHMGFITGLIDELSLEDEQKKQVMKCIGEKNAPGLLKLCKNSPHAEKLASLISLYGDMGVCLEKLKEISINDKTEAALKELSNIHKIICQNGLEKNIRLDFSVVNDMNYYNGIVFQGFIKGIPAGILSGGQYDKLLHKMGKKSGAIGFAVYLDSLQRFNPEPSSYDTDVLLLYNDNTDIEVLMKSINMLTANGKSVLAQKSVPEKISYRQLLNITDRGLEIIETFD